MCLKQYSQFLGRSNLPVLLLAIVGNCFTLSAAIYTDSIYADELFSASFFSGHHAEDDIMRIACVFVAINRCTEGLRRLYRSLGRSRSLPSAKVLWPNPTLHPSSTVHAQRLEFFSKLDRSQGKAIDQALIDDENKKHAMYLARIWAKDGAETTVLVKFAAKYNTEAHKILAEHKRPLAPRLYSCTRVIGDMYMVVMEYVPAKSLYNISPLPPRIPNVVERDVSKALELLHDDDLVFGDLQEQNVLYLPEGGGRALLVDFDGVGRDGKDMYSICLSGHAGLGVGRLQIMEKSHDSDNLERLVTRLRL